MSESNIIPTLFQRYLADQCTAGEIKQLLEYFNVGENETMLNELVMKQLEQDAIVNEPADELTERILSNIKQIIATENKTLRKTAIPFYKQRWFPAVAAAVLLIFSASAVLLLLDNKKKNMDQVAVKATEKISPVVPGQDNAMLTLADGTTIMLDSASNGQLTRQGNMKIIKVNGQISYAGKDVSGKIMYNTMATARGNQYQLQLADGSKVWLNAASSIRFPTAFNGNERRVEVTGEAYFEVAHNATKPFIVKITNASGADGGEVQVLGTHFNINAYEDETAVNTTLLQGAVKYVKANSTQLLKAGQQASASYASTVISLSEVDVEKTVAWKNGSFLFDGDNIESIMRQISRWYDVVVIYEGDIPGETFSGIVNRNSTIGQVLKIMEAGGIKFRLEGRKIIVTK